LRNDGSGWTLMVTHVGNVAARIDPFEAVELRLDSIWAE
jgi:hypothetical protein